MSQHPKPECAAGPKIEPIYCLLGASFDTNNLGVSALASSAVAAILNVSPGARIILLDYGRNPATYEVRCGAERKNVELVNLRFSWKLHLRNNIARLLAIALMSKVVPFRALRQRLILRNPCLRRIHGADIITSLSGGDSFSDIYGLRRLWYVALPQVLVLLLGKPLILLPQTLGPFSSVLGKLIGRFILRRAQHVYTRDETSLEQAKPLIGHQRISLAVDMAFALESVPPRNPPEWLSRRNGARTLVGLNVSGLLYHGGYTRDNMFGLSVDYKELIARTIAFFIEQRDADVVLVPHVFAPVSDPDSDPAACAAIYSDLADRYGGRLRLLSGSYDQHEIKHLIGRCDFFLGSRMHACIAALSQGVPAVGMAYSRKFSGVFRTVGVENLVIDLRHCDPERALELIDAVFASREQIRGGLAGRMPGIRQTALKVLSGVGYPEQPREIPVALERCQA